ncbi:MAG: protein kinase [Rubrobacter sp.]
MKKQKPWDERWHITGDLGRGGQGTTRLVTPKDDARDQGTYVLKTLNQQRDAERRGRMHREVTNLETLEHEGIPKVLDSNTDQFNNDVELYFVSTLVPDPTLAVAVESDLCELETAARTTMRIIDIVEYCHQADVIHRDIKPDNIVLKDANFDTPVLVDFGLSFNEEDAEAETLTGPQQELGNRFLWLPELRVEESRKRDPRSDVAACCGILFFMLTGMNPTSPSDENGRKPHQRSSAKAILDRIEFAEKRAVLNAIFDTGFEMQIDRRWQSAESLRSQIEKIFDASAKRQESQDPESTIRQIRNQLNSSGDYATRREVHTLLTDIDNYLNVVHSQVAAQLGSDFHTKQGGHSLDMTSASFTNKLGFVHKYYPETPFYPTFKAYITGDEVVLTGQHAAETTEILRVPVSTFSISNNIRRAIRQYFISGAAEFFADMDSGG